MKTSINTTISLLFMLCMSFLPCRAQQEVNADPTLTAMIIEFTEIAKKQYNAQQEAMAAETTGHIWLKEEIDKTKDFQAEFDKYLNSFRGVLSYAAQIYGFYYEINNLTKNMSHLIDQIGDAPANAIAVALHRKRNDIYVDVINHSVGIVNTIRQVCLDTKMTESERVQLVFSIRPKLKVLNSKLSMLAKLVHCTTLAQVWYGIERRSLPHRNGKSAIIEEGLERWRVNIRYVKPKK